MQINVKIDTAHLFARMKRGQREFPWAIVRATNETAEEIQRAEHANVGRKFIIRKPAFFFGTPGRPGGAAGRISPRASVRQPTPFAEISASASTFSSQRRFLLPTFERGGDRLPTPPAKNIAIPLLGRPARPSISRGVPPQYTFAGLRFKAYRAGRVIPRRTTRSGALSLFDEFGRRRHTAALGRLQWKGRERTFILPETKNAPHGGVFQRIGPDRGDIREIYKFQPRVRLDARLGFVPTARRVAALHFREKMHRATIKALGRSGGLTP